MKRIFTRLLAAVLLLGLIAPPLAQAQGIDPGARGLAGQAKIAAASANAKAVSASRGYPVAASNRDGGMGGLTATNVTDGTVSGATYRTYHQTPAGTAISDIVVGYSNWRWNNTLGEVAGSNNITVKAYLEYGGVNYPLTSLGQQTLTIVPGADGCFDPLPITIAANTAYAIHTYVTNAGVSSGTWPLGPLLTSYDSNNYASGGGDVSSTVGPVAGTSASYMFGPSFIAATLATPVPTVGVIGDSILAGQGDGVAYSGDLQLYQGYVARGLGNTLPSIAMTRGGFKLSQVAPGLALTRAMSLFRNGRISTAIVELGVNDSADTLATIQANMIHIWTLFTSRGVRVVQTTITPLTTTSSDGWATVANQTVNAADSTKRTPLDDWLRAGAPMLNGVATTAGTPGAVTMGQVGHPLSAILEIADVVESARNSGKFRVSPTSRSVTDGAITTGTNTFISSTANFTTADIGWGITIAGAGASGARLNAAITSVTNSTTVKLSALASTTVSGATTGIGSGTVDGLHPVPALHQMAGAVVAAGITSGAIQ